MGACTSCLGWNSYDEDERSRLLNAEEAAYGSQSQHFQGYQPQMTDPGDLEREREQLQRIVAQTNENLIDIFHKPPAQYFDPSKVEMYRILLQRTSPPHLTPMPQPLPDDSISAEERDFMEIIGKMADEAVIGLKTIKDVGDLVVRIEVGA
ncbi:hypothetical protein DRE_03914 [Drechslerella stenobrocha 248]|uniref:Late endosomal/lysosomal adaptor and MAPK and MTOR activator 1 n=1 Tax=Drechslerella stenobrocha 248 TaxID=1043628 RepID=W7I3C9_9PEZI|nr:hypothetical protein DRE_03914 [Drechslerella stenobrocha 248]